MSVEFRIISLKRGMGFMVGCMVFFLVFG